MVPEGRVPCLWASHTHCLLDRTVFAMCKLVFLAPPFALVDKQLAEGTQDHAQVSSCGTSGATWQVPHGYFAVGTIGPSHLIQQLRVNHRAARLQGMLAQKVCPDELEGAIQVTHMDAQYQRNQHFPAPGIELA